MLSYPPFTFVGDLATTSSNASSRSLSDKPQNFPALLGGSSKSFNLFYTPAVRLFSVAGQLLGFSVSREMEDWFELIQQYHYSHWSRQEP